MKRFSALAVPNLSTVSAVHLVVLFAAVLGVALLAAPVQAQSPRPKPPINNPNILGKPQQAVQSIKTMGDVKSCLAQGLPTYGLTLQTTNVRSAPTTEACRYGKLAKGTLVEITDYQVVKQQASTDAQAAAAASPAEAGPTIGYVEDIQPLFERSCSACHNAAAKTMGLQVTTYAALMAGSENGSIITPGHPETSKLWEMVGQGKMPATGPLPNDEQQLVQQWIAQGAAENRVQPASSTAAGAASDSTWFTLNAPKLVAVPDGCQDKPQPGATLASADLIAPVSCGAPPSAAELKSSLAGARPATTSAAPAALNTTTAEAAGDSQAGEGQAESSSAEVVAAPAIAAPAARGASAGGTGIEAAAFGLPAPSESDPYLIPAGFCIERRLPDNHRGITAITFAPDSRMFLAMDTDLAHEVDPLILYDAYHPSRSIAVYDWNNDMTPVEIMQESSRITGLDYEGGTLYVSRAGEVGRIPDGGSYETLAGGFSVSSQLFHANNGLVIDNGWLYVSAGGVRDGYVEGPIVGVGEEGAQQIVSGGNPFAARIVRAPLDALLSQKSIGAFSTAARGVRNPYGITADPSGRIWFTDNGATNVPDEISAGDEVNVLDPGSIGGDDASAPYYGFPLALSGSTPDWYAGPALTLVNSAAPTGITYAYGTIFYGGYGRNPGVYRVAKAADGSLIGERIMMAWPVLTLATAPDGALWVGMGDGSLFRLTSGCN